MSSRFERWLYGLGSAIISGGASAVVSGLASIGIAPDKFNMANVSGIGHLMELMLANFVVSGFIGAMFYLKQSPLPPESTGDTATFTRTDTLSVKTTAPTVNPNNQTGQ